MQPENNFIKNIVYSGSKQNVKLTKMENLRSALIRKKFMKKQIGSSVV